MRKCGSFYWYRGNMIERFGKGWMWMEESCRGQVNGIPVYKALKDVKNAIDKYLDSTNDEEPRIIQTAGWTQEKSWYIEGE